MQKKDDWRRQGQERYLKGAALELKKYKPYRDGWDHDHCEFCMTKFTENGKLSQGYATQDNYRWICQQCFDDFKDEYEWSA